MTVVIPTGARVIEIDLDTAETNVFKNTPYETHEQFYSTDIGMAFLKFAGLAQDYTGCTARLTLINFNDGSKVQRIFEMETTTTFVYPMLETELVHAGRWIGQLAVIKGGTTISDNPFRFKINGPIMSTALISFDNINTFTSQLTTIYDGLNTFLDVVILDESGRADAEGLRVVAEGLRVTAEELRATAETTRQATFEANEITRDGIVNSLVTAETIAQKVAEKYQLIEAESANRLLSVEQQLADKANQTALNVEKARIDSFTTLASGSTTGDAELIDGRIGVDGVTYPNVGGAIREQLNQVKNGYALVDGALSARKEMDYLVGSASIFDKKEVSIFGYINPSTGVLVKAVSGLGYKLSSSFLPISRNTLYYRPDASIHALYDATGTFISGSGAGTTSFTTGATAAFVRVSYIDILGDAYLTKNGSKKEFEYTKKNLLIDANNLRYVFSNSLNRFATVFATGEKNPAINLASKRVTLFSPAHVYVGNTRYSLPSDIVLNIPNESLGYFVMFRKSTNAFYLLETFNYQNITSDDYVVMLFLMNASKNLVVRNICLSKCDYIYSDNRIDYARNELIFNKNIPLNDYKPVLSTFGITSANSYTSLLQAFNDLADSSGGLITKTLLGKDSSGVHDMYVYKLSQTIVNTNLKVGEVTLQKPKVIIVGGLHGDEKASILSLYYFVKDMLDNSDTSSVLHYIKNNLDLIFIPCANPYGWDNNTRYNANGVNINRNFDYDWINATEEKGATASSEIETQYIETLIANNLDTLCLIDYHTNGSSGTDDTRMFWAQITFDYMRNNRIGKTINAHYMDVKRIIKANYNTALTDNDNCAYIIYSNAAGNLSSYSSSFGIPSLSFEGCMKLSTELTNYSQDGVMVNTLNIVNFLIALVNEYAE